MSEFHLVLLACTVNLMFFNLKKSKLEFLVLTELSTHISLCTRQCSNLLYLSLLKGVHVAGHFVMAAGSQLFLPILPHDDSAFWVIGIVNMAKTERQLFNRCLGGRNVLQIRQIIYFIF